MEFAIAMVGRVSRKRGRTTAPRDPVPTWDVLQLLPLNGLMFVEVKACYRFNKIGFSRYEVLTGHFTARGGICHPKICEDTTHYIISDWADFMEEN